MSAALVDFVTAPQWVAWRNEMREGKLTKVPYFAPGRQAEANDPSTWLPHDQAVLISDAIVNGDGGGIGIELGQCGKVWLIGTDLDTCRDPVSGTIDSWATEVIERLDSYAEVSPSETGVKVFCLVDPAGVPELRRLMGTNHGRQFKRTNGGKHPPAIELYTSNRYFAVTWEGLADAPTELRVVPLADLRWLIEQAGPALSGKAGRKRDSTTGTDDASTILGRLNTAAKHSKSIDTALRNAATMRGGSRSEGALGLGLALKRAGWTFIDMRAALLACPATHEWAAEADERQFQRIWNGPNDSEDNAQPVPPPPLDFFADSDTAAPELQVDHLPAALWDFVQDTSARMGVDPASVAMASLVSCASIMNDDWRIQPKRHDSTWTESPRLWVAIVGDPSILKTPVIAACTKPIERLDAAARERHQEEMRDYKTKLAAWKVSDDKDATQEPRQPKLARYLVESSTIEALSEALRDDDEARQYAPAKKVLSRHDEMSEFVANLDRYRTGGRGGGDRGAYLRLYNGGRYTIDRIARGSFTIPNWSACLLGGIQPGPIQKIANAADDDGLLQRFLYSVPGKQQPGLDRKPDAAALHRYEALFPMLATMSPAHSANALVLHEQAHQHRQNVDAMARAMAALPDTSPRLRAAFGKWPGLFARLCLIFHLIDVADTRRPSAPGPFLDVVPEETARCVANFMHEILLPHLMRAEAVMFATAQTTHAQWIAGHILEHRMDRITTRDVVRAYGALRPPEAKDELTAVMASLVAIGWIEPEAPKNPVKPVFAWLVNPAVHTAFEARAEREREARGKARDRLAADIEVLRRKRSEAA
jgi:Protein of unknown function (DUF3987)